MDTIFALSTPPGRAGVAVIRISGSSALEATKWFDIKALIPRRAALRQLRLAGEVLDQALVIWFEEGASFTGEDVVELQIHGSIAVRDRILSALGDIPNFRPADPGEFTRRALENGRMDISEVEGLAALIDAETEAQRRQAQSVLSGSVGAMADRWRAQLTEALALVEVTIDFADDEVPVDVTPDVLALVDGLISDLEREGAGVEFAERVREGFEVAIVGAPNAGKSTLLNALAGRPAAITSEIAGTTRDVIEVRMDLNGLPVTFLDTAGLRDAGDRIEELGISLAAERARAADLRVFLISEQDIPDVVEKRAGDIEILGKGDLQGSEERSVSGLTGKGIEGLVQEISEALQSRTAMIGTATHRRHQIAMEAAAKALREARAHVLEGPDSADLAAQDLRHALSALDRLIGRVDVEAVLDHIFSRFCLGK